VEWLEQDQISRFRELLDFLLKSKPIKPKKKSKRACYDPLQHHCVLDQDTGEEEEEDDTDE